LTKSLTKQSLCVLAPRCSFPALTGWKKTGPPKYIYVFFFDPIRYFLAEKKAENNNTHGYVNVRGEKDENAESGKIINKHCLLFDCDV